jgi:hypothetical protein
MPRVALLPFLPKLFCALEVPLGPERLQPAGVPAASEGRLSPSQNRDRSRICRDCARQSAQVARGPCRLPEDVPPVSSSRGRPQSPASTGAGCEAASPTSCKEQPGSGLKTLCRRGMARGPGGARSCKEQPGFLSDVHFSATCTLRNPSARILKRTSCWFGVPNALIT